MRLTRIRIKGFKSFADETELLFDRGVGVIVGPNGSGKSNIAEALRWAMASQAPSEVRVATGLDVLFSGSESRAAAGVAEVELVLEDEGGVAPGGRPELSVLRRLSRDGESQYHLNRVPVRRLDVHEVLADIGLGKDSHAIIGQNQVDTVLLASPAVRRGLIEEVAGLGKFKRRRVRAQQKLNRVERHLVEARTRQADVAAHFFELRLVHFGRSPTDPPSLDGQDSGIPENRSTSPARGRDQSTIYGRAGGFFLNIWGYAMTAARATRPEPRPQLTTRLPDWFEAIHDPDGRLADTGGVARAGGCWEPVLVALAGEVIVGG